ncbi:3-oxoacyl-ACP reductase FabG [Mycobacteroides abscessus]|uniref:3-oxoacyl-[acyl-carrier-protein] reductase MabA n=1 Tax=Mycobacteroides abscessus subsp. abscessus TaxID=1185650 RepID=A0AB38D4F2_9MYCO|nr:3-oxoacyl-ACP reductase family protein [Mycobacteroides abscessus]AKP57998.1 3-oxoacyl-ACP reductase [Mycobacteroides abscessus UC22]MBE5419909.1 hypothetical protein [Mycobacteroides abscessus]MBE5455391.1 hypothetical protein [Mycobacteroides abscessus]MBE5462145.1 hypothetical protein [Mycobacteroides abscessus]MBN7326333.1 3-oxoacyl-ACP reductase FabG [Mycobacteroides abscessus subsp. abscessus]
MSLSGKEFEGQVALVTGASRGIGRSIALALAEHGADIALHYGNSKPAAEEVAEKISALGRRVLLCQGDIADPAVPELLADRVHAEFGRIDVLVNNAGTHGAGLLLDIAPDYLEETVATNLLGPIRMTKAVVAHMLGQRYGRIINISSVAADKPDSGQSTYAATKGGLESFTKAIAVEFASRNIISNAVAPGVVYTDMAEITRTHVPATFERLKAQILAKDFAKPEIVADAVLYLASPHNTYITGEVLHIDGGYKMK